MLLSGMVLGAVLCCSAFKAVQRAFAPTVVPSSAREGEAKVLERVRVQDTSNAGREGGVVLRDGASCDVGKCELQVTSTQRADDQMLREPLIRLAPRYQYKKR